jgi:glycosyltransferase involved in cell wall biosynthesis
MLIGFEAKRFFKNYTGLGNYSRFIINALSDHFPDNHYYLYTPTHKSHPEVDSVLKKRNIQVICPPKSYPKFVGSVWRTWGISREPATRQLQIFHGLSQELPLGLPPAIKKVVTIHDLIFLRFPRFYNPIDVKIYTAKVKFACKHADKIIAISNQTASDIVEYLNIDKSKVDIVYQGCHPIFKRRVPEQEIKEIRMRYNLPQRYLLNVGTIEARKNALILVEALLHIPETLRLPVVIAGKATKYTNVIHEFIAKHNLGKWVQFLHQASFSDFPGLYQGAEAFIYPSLFEGFGIPLVEAIESEIPVITSKGSSFVDAAGENAIFVDPHDAEGLAREIIRVTQDSNLRDTMIRESTKYIQRFKPQVIASELNSLYDSMISRVGAAV